MKRIDLIFNKLKELGQSQGISAKEIAEALDLDRSNVSRDLNQLVNNNKAIKIKGKPVLFRLAQNKQ